MTRKLTTANVTSGVWIHMIYVWKWCMHSQCLRVLAVHTVNSCHYRCSAPTWRSLRRALKLAFPLVLVLLLLRHSGDLDHRDRKWI